MADTAPDKASLETMARKLRRFSIQMTSEAGSGHPTTCMSAAEIMAILFFDEMRIDVTTPASREADVFVMSKGHAAPILYAALKECGAIDDDLLTLRKSSSRLEGHPVPRLPWVKIATGSLGQGLAAAAGMAVARKMDGLSSRVYALMGDGETAEGSIWEAAQFATAHKLDNLVGIVDMNALGQSGPTMHKDDGKVMAAKFAAFGWDTAVVDGHDVDALRQAFSRAHRVVNRPFAIVAMTKKGKGVSFLEGKEGWHGKPLKKGEEAEKALAELGEANISLKARPPEKTGVKPSAMPPKMSPKDLPYKLGEEVATREAYGFALARLGAVNPTVVVTDADVKNSTYADKFLKAFPARFVEAFIAEQNMVGAALGMANEGKTVFASTFACFLSRAYDFIRMAGFSRRGRLILCGSHAGVSIGEDGPSQMALEDMAMMRPIFGSYVLYPSDAVCTEKLVYESAATEGIGYIRTSRPKTKVIYATTEEFPIGGSKTVRQSAKDSVTVIGAGVTLYEALKAYDTLKSAGTEIRVIDAYSIKPIDAAAVLKAAQETGYIVTVEDHSVFGGLGDAVCQAVAGKAPVKVLGIKDIPKSATPDELLAGYGIDANAIVAAVKDRPR